MRAVGFVVAPTSFRCFCSPFVLQPINYKFDHSYVLDTMKKHPGKVRSDIEARHPYVRH